jgi:hypothetical protein
MGINPIDHTSRAVGKDATSEATGESALTRFARWAFVAVAAAFVVCVAVQIFLAGLATFVHPLNWVRHAVFVHFFEVLPLGMLVFGFIGRLPARQRWQSAGLFGLIFMQYFTANFRAIAPWVAALHPLTGTFILWLAIVVVQEAWRIVRSGRAQ